MEQAKTRYIAGLFITVCCYLISYSANAAVCSSPLADTNGDGYGIENGQSCVVVSSCKYTDSDSDGDGWGWENNRSCIMTTSGHAVPDGECIDSDGDGWGWDGSKSCLMDTSTKCIDSEPLGDGWGWNGVTSCELPATLTESPDIKDITDVVLVTGQSNTLGCNTAVEPGLDDPDNRVFAWSEDGWVVADLHQVWDLGWHPRTTPDGKNPHNNFALHFGKTVVANSDRVIAFILVSAPGKPIEHWDKDRPFFSKVRSQVETALAELPHINTISAILWHQGENNWQGGDYYQSKLSELIHNLRIEPWHSHNGLFICGETFKAPVNRNLNQLNSDGDIKTACVSAIGLGVQADEVHFNAYGLRTLGERYANKYLSLLSGDRSSM